MNRQDLTSGEWDLSRTDYAKWLEHYDHLLHSATHPADGQVFTPPENLQGRLAHGLDCLDKLRSYFSQAAPAAKMQEQESFGPYCIKREIGRGGFGVVYQAEDTRLGRTVALKIPHPYTLNDPVRIQRFRVEAQAAASLEHSGIIGVHETGVIGGVEYICSEYAHGVTLSDWMTARQQSCDWEAIANLVAQLASAIAYAHKRGVLHRDIKPANIILVPKDESAGCDPLGYVTPKITDFGLAKFLQTDCAADTATGQILGTAAYMAPEQAMGRSREIGTAADIYSLGTILYELLTGRSPFEGSNMLEVLDKVRHQEPVRPSLVCPQVPLDLETICLKCLQKQPSARYGNADELQQDLVRFMQGEVIAARPVSSMERVVKWARRSPALAGLSIALLFSMLIGLATSIYLHRQAELALEKSNENNERAVRILDDVLHDIYHTRQWGLIPELGEFRSRWYKTASRHINMYLSDEVHHKGMRQVVLSNKLLMAQLKAYERDHAASRDILLSLVSSALQLLEQNPHDAIAMSLLGAAYYSLYHSYHENNKTEQLAYLDTSILWYQRSLAENTGIIDPLYMLTVAWHAKGMEHGNSTAQAIAYYKQALRCVQQLHAALDIHTVQTRVINRYDVLFQECKLYEAISVMEAHPEQLPQALEYAERSMKVSNQMLQEYPLKIESWETRLAAYIAMANAYEMSGQLEEATFWCRQGLCEFEGPATRRIREVHDAYTSRIEQMKLILWFNLGLYNCDRHPRYAYGVFQQCIAMSTRMLTVVSNRNLRERFYYFLTMSEANIAINNVCLEREPGITRADYYKRSCQHLNDLEKVSGDWHLYVSREICLHAFAEHWRQNDRYELAAITAQLLHYQTRITTHNKHLFEMGLLYVLHGYRIAQRWHEFQSGQSTPARRAASP